jgi:hypothetical protein
MSHASRGPTAQEIQAAFSSGVFVVPLPGRRALPTPMLFRDWLPREFPLPDFRGVPSGSRFGFEGFSTGEDNGDSDFVPGPVDEEEDYEEEQEEQEEEEGEERPDDHAVLKEWLDRFEDGFVLPLVDGGVGDWRLREDVEEYDEVIRGIPVHVRPRDDVKRVEAVFAEVRMPHPRGLLSDLSRRFDVPASTVRFWFRHWVRVPEWRPYIRVAPGNQRLFSDQLEEQMVAEIEDTFWREERKISRRIFKEFVKKFWAGQHPEVQTWTPLISNHFCILFCQRRRLSFRKPAMLPFRSRQLSRRWRATFGR